MVTGLGSWGPVRPCRRRALVRLVRCSAAGAKALAALPLNGLTPVQAGNRADLRAAPASPGITCPSGSPGSLPEPPQHRHPRFFLPLLSSSVLLSFFNRLRVVTRCCWFWLSVSSGAVLSPHKRPSLGAAANEGGGCGGGGAYLLGLLAKIKCSICSYQLNF